ncbi:MAG: hypothetical protein HN948_06515 [Clostridia bacterium]|jgi:hypothetical protein|nr:hypothetical protein [Clostridia bacterium]MBT7122645.1 hypothetical protein [Clostridia bacterium]
MKKQKKAADGTQAAKKPFSISNGLAIFLAILFVFFSIFGLIGFNIWRVLFNPQLVKQTLTQEVTQTQLVPSALELFSEGRAQQRVENSESLSGVTEPDIVLLLSFMKAEDWQEVRQLLVTDEFVVHLISTSVDGLYLWIDSEDEWPAINWDMRLLKERMVGQEGIDAVMVAYSKMPEATDEQIADFKHRLSQVPEGVEVLYNLAQFPDPWFDDQVADYVDALQDANDNIPADFDFSKEFGLGSSEQSMDPLVVKNILRIVRFAAIAFWVIALILLILILSLKVRSRNTLGRFVGIPMLIIGAIVVAIAIVGKWAIMSAVAGSLLSMTSDFARLEITNSVARLTALFFQPLLIQGAVVGAIGIILIVIMLIRRRKGKGASSELPKTTTGEA